MSGDQDTRQDSPDTDEAKARHRRLVGFLTILVIGSWLLMMAPLPYSLFAGITALGALVLLIPLVVRAFRQGRRGTAVFVALLGVPATLMIVTSSLLSLLFYGPMSEVEQCRAAAITEQARSICEEQAQTSMSSWFSTLLGG